MARLSRWYLVATLALAVGAPATLSFESDAVAAQKKRRGKKRRRGKSRRATKAPPPPPPAPAPASDVVPNTQFRGPTRIDFDDRLIQGQTNKSGAVYLFDRKETGISSMVKRRKSFRHLTIRTVYDR
ncbi:MAG: hypothetical protein RIT81_18935 [Deltaproteobacteria bacterium]